MVSLTERAATEIVTLLEKQEKQGHALRIWIQGGGCSGYEYGMALDDSPAEEDLKFESNGVKVVVDAQSYPYLDGSEIDFVETLMGGGFKVDNPNAASTCGCGQSFQGKDGEAPEGGGCSSCSSAKY